MYSDLLSSYITVAELTNSVQYTAALSQGISCLHGFQWKYFYS